MSDTNDNLSGVAPEGTTTNNQQAVGADGSVSQQNQQAASTETTGELILGKFKTQDELIKAYQNIEKLASRKSVDASALGLTTEKGAEQQAQPGQQQVARAEAREVAQQAGGDDLEAWFNKNAQAHGTGKAVAMLAQYIATQTSQAALAQTLAPVNQQLASGQERIKALVRARAAEELAREYDDFLDHGEDFKAYWKAHPRMHKELMDTDDETEAREILDTAYARITRNKAKNATAAAKVAGVVDSRQREEMKATTVTEGSGPRSEGKKKDAADGWLDAMQEFEKGKKLFG